MNKIKGAFKSIEKFTSDNAPTILTILGATGLVTTVIFAVRATPKALSLLDKAEEEKGEQLTPVEVVKTAWKPYIPTAISGATSIACIVCANSVNTKRNAALAAAYKVSETALLEYKDAVVETIGEKKEHEVKQKVAEKHVRENPPVDDDIVLTGHGNYLCYDSLSGRYFRSTQEKVQKAINELNASLINEMYISLNEYYDAIGLDCTALGNDLGWNSPELIDTYYGAVRASNDEPCMTIEHYNMPGPRYSSR